MHNVPNTVLQLALSFTSTTIPDRLRWKKFCGL